MRGEQLATCAAGMPSTATRSRPFEITVAPAFASTVIAAGASGVCTSTRPSEAAAISSATDRSARRRPRPITIRWSAVPSSSLMRWLDTKTVRPSAASARSVSRIHWIPSGSRPIVGSSRMRIGGSPRSAAATPRRCRIPRESARARLRRDAREPDEVQDLVDPVERDPVAPGEPAQVVARRPARVDRAGVEERPDDRERALDRPVPPPRDERLAGVCGREPEQELHRGRLARAVRPDEAGDLARPDREREAVDRERPPVPLRQAAGLDRHVHGSDGTAARRDRVARERCLSSATHR